LRKIKKNIKNQIINLHFISLVFEKQLFISFPEVDTLIGLSTVTIPQLINKSEPPKLLNE
jgi:hypothetical protein